LWHNTCYLGAEQVFFIKFYKNNRKWGESCLYMNTNAKSAAMLLSIWRGRCPMELKNVLSAVPGSLKNSFQPSVLPSQTAVQLPAQWAAALLRPVQPARVRLADVWQGRYYLKARNI
jgi:hypothetical protein